MSYELTRTTSDGSGERQPEFPELTKGATPRPTPARATPATQRTSFTYKSTPAPVVPPREVYVPPPLPSRFVVAWRGFRDSWARIEWGVTCLALFYLALQAAHGVWLYYYIDVELNPNPRRFINSTGPRWHAYVAFLWIFGTLYMMINFYLFGTIGILAISCQICHRQSRTLSILGAIILPPICAFFIVVPMWGSLIFTTPLQRVIYNHRCDSWAAQVVLDGRSYQDPLYVPNTALFVTAGDSRRLFSYDLDQTESSWARFHFRKFESAEETIEPQYMPVVRDIVYDFVNLKVNGTCGTDATPCLSGSFDMNGLMMDLTFNLTAGAPEIHSRARSVERQWTWSGGHPALIYKTINDDSSLGDTLLQTAVTRAGDCTRLKTCLAGSKIEGAGGVFGPDVLLPLGIMLAKQGAYGKACTTPSS